MLRAFFLTALLVETAAAQGGGRSKPARPDSLILKDSVVAAERRFLVQWDSLWRSSQRTSNAFTVAGDVASGWTPRLHNLHCHPDVGGDHGAFGQGRLIKSEFTAFSVCPSWDLGDFAIRVEERLALDTLLTDVARPVARTLRGGLLKTLDSAANILPSDDFLAGQRVRFLVDQRDLDRALAVARECGANSWWCSALAGYVLGARGDVVRADLAFTAALAAMPAEQRCRWTDHRLVIDAESQKKYADIACAKRDAVNERLWWLADPLFIEPGNERKVEQHMRTMLLELRTALDRDERYSWDNKAGNDARRVMIVRYGAPSFAFWGGQWTDSGHSGYLRMASSGPNTPYTSYEYFGARSHLVPSWGAISDPFRALPDDWDMSPPDPRENPPPPPPPVATSPATLYAPRADPIAPRPPRFWWPAEHFQPHFPLAQLPEGQHGLFRRKDGALLAVATDLPALRIGRRAGDTIPAITLVTSEQPDHARRAAVAHGVTGGSVAIHGLIPSTPAMAGLEFMPGVRAPIAGRLRFGITPPPPLAALKAGEVAISDPVIVRVPRGGSPPPNEPDAALKQLAASRMVGKGGQMGVYWETYGFAPTDSVEVAVWIERYTGQGIARRFGIAMRIATDLNTPVSVSWNEPNPGHSSHVSIEGAVPVVSRALVMNVSTLPPGNYRLEVAVRKLRQEPVRGRTTFIVQ